MKKIRLLAALLAAALVSTTMCLTSFADANAEDDPEPTDIVEDEPTDEEPEDVEPEEPVDEEPEVEEPEDIDDGNQAEPGDVEPEAPATGDTDAGTTNPKTGVAFAVIPALVAGAAAVASKSKKK